MFEEQSVILPAVNFSGKSLPSPILNSASADSFPSLSGLPQSTQMFSSDRESVRFDTSTGLLSIFGNAEDNTARAWMTDSGFLNVALDGQTYSSDPSSQFYDPLIGKATRDTLSHIDFNGGAGEDTLILGNQNLSGNLDVQADDAIEIAGNITTTGNLAIAADTVSVTGSLTGSSILVTGNDKLGLKSGAIVTAKDGDKGGTVHLLGKEVSLTGANVDASGANGGGTVLVGGDLHGQGTVRNAATTFISSDSAINADALQSGKGGKVVVWADGKTDFYGKISARGGANVGDGGFIEVSGKQNLKFEGKTDTGATKGKLGTLLLDPLNITISSQPDSADGSIVNVTNLTSQTGNVTLAAQNNITVVGNLDFNAAGGAITFLADSDADSVGAFSMGGSSKIWTVGRDVNISGASVSTGQISTALGNSSSGGNISLTATAGNIGVGGQLITGYQGTVKGGNITLAAANGSITTGGGVYTAGGTGGSGAVKFTAKNDIAVGGQIHTQNNFSVNGGAITLESSSGGVTVSGGDAALVSYGGNGGVINVKALGNITTGFVQSFSSGKSNGVGGNITFTSTTGSISTSGQEVTSYTSDGTRAGNVTFNAVKDITIGKVYAPAFNAGKGGIIKLTTTTGNINTNGGEVNASSSTGNGGTVNLNATLGSVTTGGIYGITTNGNSGTVSVTAKGKITTGEVKTYNNGNGVGGNITLNSKNDSISTAGNEIVAYSSNGTSGGNVTLSAVNDITTGRIYAPSFSAGSGGIIKLTSTKGSINTNGGQVDASSGAGNASAITLKATVGNISTGGIYATHGAQNTPGNGGAVSVTAKGSITAGDVHTYTNGSGVGGTITLNSTGTGTGLNGGITTTTVKSYSFGGGNAGDMTLTAEKDIKTQEVFAGAFSNFNGGNLTLTSRSGGIDANGQGISSRSFYGNGGFIKLSAAKDIAVGEVSSRVEGNGLNGGEISLVSSGGNVTAKWLRSDSFSGIGGNITVDAAKLVKVTDSVAIDEIDYSIYTGANGVEGDGSITIKHGGGATATPFIVAALKGVGETIPFTNGTAADISSASSGLFAIQNPLVYPASQTIGDISLITNYTGSDPEPYVPIDPSYDFDLLANIVDNFPPDGPKGSTRTIPPEEWKPGNQPLNYYVGNSAHRKIGGYYRANHPGPGIYTNTTPISSILKDQQGSLKGLTKAQLDKRPDILDWPQKYIYEIKPRGRTAEAIEQVNTYIQIFKKAKVTLQLGPSEENGTYGVEPFPGGLFVFGSPQKGVILYRSYRRDKDTEIDTAKVTTGNIRDAIAIQKSGFPDDIFAPDPTPVPAPPIPSYENTPSIDILRWLVPPIFRNPERAPI